MFSSVSYVLERQENAPDLTYMKAFRALRALRPLKLVSKNEGMKNVVNSLLSSIPNLINVMLISLLFYFVFGIIGLQSLMGRVSDCDDPAYNTKLECLAAGHEWIVPNDNYNHIGHSMLVFFEVSTLEMWPDIMFRAVNSPAEQDVGMTEGARPHLAFIYIAFIFVTSFFVMNLFISVIVS